LQAVDFILKQEFPDKQDAKPFNCYDNAMSTLGKLIYFQAVDGIMTPQIINEHFLAKLPLSTDSNEA
jgi:hypothetical protein